MASIIYHPSTAKITNIYLSSCRSGNPSYWATAIWCDARRRNTVNPANDRCPVRNRINDPVHDSWCKRKYLLVLGVLWSEPLMSEMRSPERRAVREKLVCKWVQRWWRTGWPRCYVKGIRFHPPANCSGSALKGILVIRKDPSSPFVRAACATTVVSWNARGSAMIASHPSLSEMSYRSRFLWHCPW